MGIGVGKVGQVKEISNQGRDKYSHGQAGCFLCRGIVFPFLAAGLMVLDEFL